MTLAEALAEIERLQRLLKSQEERIAKLEAALAQALRQQHRQVAPFRREAPPSPEPAHLKETTPSDSGPRRPGRKVGHKADFRPRLPATHFQSVPLPRGPEKTPCCPDCGSLLLEVEERVQQVVDLPPTDCIVTDITLEAGKCPRCRTEVTTLNPLTGSGAVGETASVQIGPRIIALAALLHHERAVPLEAIAELIFQLSGLHLQPSTLVRALQRLTERAAPQLAQIQQALQQSTHVNMDETGWRVDGSPASLHVAVAPQHTLYKITPGRGSDVPAATLGPDFKGVLSSDGSPIYDDLPCSDRQTCLSHLARKAQATEQVVQGRGKAFPRQVLAWVRSVIDLKPKIAQLPPQEGQATLQKLKDELLEMCGGPPDRYGYENQGLANYMFNRRDFWLTFLEHPGIPGLDGTNNAAERAIRPAVRCRKVSGGSRSWKGAQTHAALASLIRTFRQQAKDPERELVNLQKPLTGWSKRKLQSLQLRR